MSTIGCIVLVAVNIAFVPRIGYMACAWGGLAGYGVCVLLSYFIGQRKNPVPYPVAEIAFYFLLALALFALMHFLPVANTTLRLVVNTLLLAVYVGVVLWRERTLVAPVVNRLKRFIRK